MTDRLTLFQMMGVSDADGAAQIWPSDVVTFAKGKPLADLLKALEEQARFSNVRVGADAVASFGSSSDTGQVTLSAQIELLKDVTGLFIKTMPGLTITLKKTNPAIPARLFLSHDARGLEVVLEDAAVDFIFDSGLITAMDTSGTGKDVVYGAFTSSARDQLAITLKPALDPKNPSATAAISVFSRFHLTPEDDLFVEPNVPLSIPACRWMGLPVKAIYDLQILPSPARSQERLEWATNDITAFPVAGPKTRGALAVRGVDLDQTQEPFKWIAESLLIGYQEAHPFELVCEDVVTPVGADSFPIPSHGRFGLRRKINDKGDLANNFGAKDAAIRVIVRKGTPNTSQIELLINRIIVESSSDTSPTPSLHVDVELLWFRNNGDTVGGKLVLSDDWTLMLGVVLGVKQRPGMPPIGSADGSYMRLTSLFGFELGIRSLKLGLGIGRLARHDYQSFADCLIIVADLVLRSEATGKTGKLSKVLTLQASNGKELTLVLRDVGWWLGQIKFDGLELPEGAQLLLFKKLRFLLEELGVSEEADGTPYFLVSGGIELTGPASPQKKDDKKKVALAKGSAKDAEPADASFKIGVYLRRFRFRMNDDESKALIKLDGLSLRLDFGVVKILGFGVFRDETIKDSGKEYSVNEVGIGIKIEVALKAFTLKVGGMFFRGVRSNLADPNDSFTYLLAGIFVGEIPAGPITLYDLRALVAYNLTPKLSEAVPDNGMVLLDWYKTNKNALEINDGRFLAPWKVQDRSVAVGIGCGFSFAASGKAFKIDIFIFVHRNEATWGLLIQGSLFLFGNTGDPDAYLVIEYDAATDKFGALFGVNLTITKLIGGEKAKKLPKFLRDLIKLEGTMFLGNRPWTFAIGQLTDQATWLTLKAESTIFVLFKILFGLCIEIVEGGRKGFGILFSVSLGADWLVVKWLAYGSFSFVLAVWKTSSTCVSVVITAELGVKITLLWVFTFGASIKGTFDYLGTKPWSLTLRLEIHLETPWFLPDFDFEISKKWPDEDTAAFAIPLLNRVLRSASAFTYATNTTVPLIVPPVLRSGNPDTATLYSFEELLSVQGATAASVDLSKVPVVPTDARVSMEMTNPLSNDSVLAGAGNDAGVQTVKDVTLRYALASVTVRRRPRRGSTAWVVSDKIERFPAPAGDGEVTFSSPVFDYQWSVESRADGKLAPLRLTLNATTPFSFSTSAQTEEGVVRNDRQRGCCTSEDIGGAEPRWRELVFAGPGDRVPPRQRFSMQGAYWQWDQQPAPLVAARRLPFDDALAAKDRLASPAAHLYPDEEGAIGSATLADPANKVSVLIGWPARPQREVEAVIVLEGYHGTEKVAQRTLRVNAGSRPIFDFVIEAPWAKPMTSIALYAMSGTDRLGPDSPAVGSGPSGSPPADPDLVHVELLRIAYLPQDELMRCIMVREKCEVLNKTVGRGTVFFLPNHIYEVVVEGNLRVTYKGQSRQTSLSEPLYFATKGLVGLNAVGNVGDELKPYVAALYPPPERPILYRDEPACIVWNDKLTTALPLSVRLSGREFSDEAQQVMPMMLTLARVSSGDTAPAPLTASSPDWLSTSPHRPAPAAIASPRVARGLDDPGSAAVDASTGVLFPKSKDVSAVAGDDVKYVMRKGPSADGFERRGAIIDKAKGCPVVEEHPAQTLLHEPVDKDAARGPWQPQTTYEASVRLKGAPYIARDSFLEGDDKAFYYGTERFLTGTPSAPWTRQADGTLKAAGKPTEWDLATAGNRVWDYLQLSATFEAEVTAGVAFGVDEVLGTLQSIAVVVENSGSARTLALYSTSAGTRQLLAKPKAPVDLGQRVTLIVTVFDDLVRVVAKGQRTAADGKVTLAEETLEAPRDFVRNGRIALVSGGAAVFSALRVEGLELYRFRFAASRYRSFAEHVESIHAGGDSKQPVTLPRLTPAKDLGTEPVTLGTDVLTPAEVKGIDAIETVEERQALFAASLKKLGAPLRQQCDKLALTRVIDAKGAAVLLLESPEPILFRSEVQLTVTHKDGTAVPVKVLGNATSTAALIVAESSFGDQPLILTFKLARKRWPTTGGEPAASYSGEASLTIQ